MIIDANQDGIFGNTVASVDDVYLTGVMNSGANSITWKGRNNAGVALPNGVYQAQLQARLGEYHFVAVDAESSGGNGSTTAGNSLAIYGVTTGGTRYGTNNY
jgi:flagellar hook assembly protein FlgD